MTRGAVYIQRIGRRRKRFHRALAGRARGRGTIAGIFTLWAYVVAALAELAGCFAFWAWLRLGKTVWWVLPGTLSLVLFALALTRIDSPFAGRAFAAYGGVYIAASLLWLWLIEGTRPDRWDLAGGAVCLLGAGIILLGPRTA